MASDETLRWLDATAQAQLVAAGQVSPRELVEAAVRRAEALNPALNAIIHPCYDEALAAADAAPAGPLRGVPFVVKDLVAQEAGRPFHEGSRFLKDIGHTGRHDQVTVTRARAAGLVSIGRANTSEFGMRPACEPLAYGPTHNPWRQGFSPGGSSGGPAACVAAGIVAIAHANDVGGSIRVPASMCGLVGLKPSRGRSTFAPDFGDAMLGLAEELVVCRTVRDAALALDLLSGPAVGEFTAAWPRPSSFRSAAAVEPSGVRVGMLADRLPARFDPHDGIAVHPDVAAAVSLVGTTLEGLGHHVSASAPPALGEDIGSFAFPHYLAGMAWIVDHHWHRVLGQPIPADRLEPVTAFLLELGRRVTGAALLEARELAQLWVRRLLAWWEVDGFDLLVLPTVAVPPPAHAATDDVLVLASNGPFNISGQPAISVPVGESDGLPVGVQLVAGPGREDLLLQVAAQLEGALPWAQRVPPASPS